MRCTSVSRILSLLVVCAIFCPSVAISQQPEEIRPRRAQSELQSPDPPLRADQKPSKTYNSEWKPPNNSITQLAVANVAITGPEPTMRIALATDVRAATVSTNSQLLSATDLAQTFVPLEVARVRVEARLLAPLPASDETFAVRMAGLATRAQAESQARLIRNATSDQSQIVLDVQTNTWGLLIGPRRSREAAEIAQMRLDDEGFPTSVVDLSTPPTSTATTSSISTVAAQTSENDRDTSRAREPIRTPQIEPAPKNTSSTNSYVRLASRNSIPTRELVASTPSSAKLFSSSAPVLFASTDEAKAPVRFNEKPYRGRIEVFANTRGLLTVVNVIGLEDYVRGVVANELSPGGYPALDALKAQAIAARTYAVRNRGQYMSQGFDLLPTTRSQVYRGLSSEQPLSTRAVDETRGVIATFAGEPINALYTSTCGGRTEDAANIFNEEVPYLHGRECSIEGRNGLQPFTIRTAREASDVKEEQHGPVTHLIAELAVHGFGLLQSRLTDSWLAAPASADEVRIWLTSVAALAHQTPPVLPDDVNRPPQFATALSRAAFGESRADTLMSNVDVEYFLAVRDAAEIPAVNRSDTAMMVRDGYLSVFPDASVRPREPMTRARVLRAVARLLENRSLLQIQRGTARPSAGGSVILRSTKGKDQALRVVSDLYLFRQLGDSLYPVRSVVLVGGEPVSFHVNTVGEVDYLEVRPAPGGAAADRFSPFSNWNTELTPGEVRARLGRAALGIGSLLDLRVVARGTSRRATDLAVIGTEGITHVRGGRIRSALGLREQLFVIDKKYDSDGRVVSFVFTGRGWGHGVGMCQVGAYGLARQGLTYEQILKTYYTGIELTRLY